MKFRVPLLLALVLGLLSCPFAPRVLAQAPPVQAQESSLGDLARANREKQNPDKKKAKVVVDNDSLRTSPSDIRKPVGDTDSAPEDSRPQRVAGKPSAAEVRAAVAQQKAAIANLQQQADNLEKSVRYVQQDLHYNGAQWNEQQRRKQEMVQQLHQRIEEEKQRLSDMQDAARKAGFGSSVYD